MIDKINVYKDKFFIRFDEGGDAHKSITNLPHYKTWRKVLGHLKNRGFEIKTCNYHLEQNWAQALNKVAFRGNVGFLRAMAKKKFNLLLITFCNYI